MQSVYFEKMFELLSFRHIHTEGEKIKPYQLLVYNNEYYVYVGNNPITVDFTHINDTTKYRKLINFYNNINYNPLSEIKNKVLVPNMLDFYRRGYEERLIDSNFGENWTRKAAPIPVYTIIDKIKFGHDKEYGFDRYNYDDPLSLNKTNFLNDINAMGLYLEGPNKNFNINYYRINSNNTIEFSFRPFSGPSSGGFRVTYPSDFFSNIKRDFDNLEHHPDKWGIDLGPLHRKYPWLVKSVYTTRNAVCSNLDGRSKGIGMKNLYDFNDEGIHVGMSFGPLSDLVRKNINFRPFAVFNYDDEIETVTRTRRGADGREETYEEKVTRYYKEAKFGFTVNHGTFDSKLDSPWYAHIPENVNNAGINDTGGKFNRYNDFGYTFTFDNDGIYTINYKITYSDGSNPYINDGFTNSNYIYNPKDENLHVDYRYDTSNRANWWWTTRNSTIKVTVSGGVITNVDTSLVDEGPKYHTSDYRYSPGNIPLSQRSIYSKHGNTLALTAIQCTYYYNASGKYNEWHFSHVIPPFTLTRENISGSGDPNGYNHIANL